MAPALAELTAQAQTLTSAGDLVGARAVLADVLDPIDVADPQRATADLAVAAALHARILIALGDPHSARLWAAFAHAAEDRLHGPHDERTLAAAVTHAAVLHRVGNHGRAAHVYHDLVLELINLDGPDSQRVLAAQADLATAEHSAGNCTAARARLTEAWTRHRRLYGDAEPSGIKMLARLGAMERECGRVSDAQHHLAMAEALCVSYLPGDHPLRQQVTALAQAPASGRHRCGRVEQSIGPDGPDAGATPVRPAAAQATAAAPRSAPGDLTGRDARTEEGGPLPGEGLTPSDAAPEPLLWPPDARRDAGHATPLPAESTGVPAAQAGPSAGPAASTPLSAAPGASRPARPATVTPPPAEPPVFVPLPAAGPPAHDPLTPTDPPAHEPHRSADPQAHEPHTPADPQVDAPHTPADPHAHETHTPALLPQDHETHGPPVEPRTEPSPVAGVRHPAEAGQPHVAPRPTWPGIDPEDPDWADGVREVTPGAAGRIYTAGPRAAPAYPGPAEAVMPTGRAGPVGWRPPASPPPAASAMRPVPHPEIVRQRPAPGEIGLVPVPMERPDKRGPWQPLGLIAVIVAGILVAAGAVAATLPRGDDEAAVPGPAASLPISSAPPPSASASAAGAPPDNVKLRDNRDSVSLTWDYPDDAEGPVLISGGRAGQAQKAFQQLPAGTTDYVVYGLNNAQDYCFTVAVVYAVDTVAASKPICTNRK